VTAGTSSGQAESARAGIIRAASLLPIKRILFLAAPRIPFVFGRVAQEPACPSFRLHALAALGPRVTGASLKKIQIKRIYEPATASDGTRILVDRLWPRGVARDEARIDAWIKDVAPSDALRRWYSHDPEKWPEFRARYIAELKHNPAVVELQDMATKSKTLTLLFAAKDNLRNNATVLQEFLSGGAE
jgi:uncharacterized protein YeaO (DUF488 family)